jgi:putative NIF3 family GTP cyclohydrolase 1 type 2
VVGQGRLLQLAQPLTLSAAVALVKEHVGASVLRVADATDTSRCIRSVALCAGAGGSVVTKVAADLYLSGEMRHHDVLRAVATGTSVVLTEHSNSERGYLPHLAQRLRQAGLHAIVAATDSDPLRCV